MSAKQTAKTDKAEKKEKAPPTPRKTVCVRVKTKGVGVKRVNSGVIFTNEWKRLLLDDKGSAYKAIRADPALAMETLPDGPFGDDKVATNKLPHKEQEAK